MFDEITLPFLLSVLITSIFVPIAIKLALRFKLVDDPNVRTHPAHINKKIVPRAGGLAIYFGVFLTILLLLPISKSIFGIFLGSTILLIIGLIDDRLHKFNPYLRLALLFLAASTAVFGGIGISFITNPLSSIFPKFFSQNIIRLDQIILPINFFGTHNIILLADLFAFFWIVTLTQVINWSKGVDGQMPSITLVTAFVLGVLSLRLFLSGDPNQLFIAKLAFITAGASLGFLIFNWFPAKIYPGFSGSTILAFLLAVLSILSGAKLATASLCLGIPIIDFIYTFTRRILQHKSPVWGDRGHLHHKLLDLGWSHQKISLFYLLGSGMLGSVALLSGSEGKFFAFSLMAIIILGFIVWINSFGDLSKKSDHDSG